MRWNLSKQNRSSTAASRNTGRRFRPGFEAMEERIVPTVVDPVNFTENNYVDFGNNLFATGMAWAPDGSNRLFALQKNGVVRLAQNGAVVPTPFATVTPVYTNSECGLIGITFDRDFVNNHFVYLFVTVSNSEQQIIRYTDTNNIGTNKTILVSGLTTAGQNHDGGGIGIGLDNKLYWSIGDNGNGTGVDNDLTNYAAKVSRANLDGSPVDDNPFNNHNGIVEPRDYTWSRGWRNPFTFTFQESTGQLWIDDVGTLYEQVFKVNAGDHAGYNDFEGNQPAGYIQPEIVYRTNGTDSRTIVAGGAVRSGNVVTITTSAPSASTAFLQPGNKITISGVADSSFNGSFDILAVLSPTQFTYTQSGTNAASGGGTAVTAGIGGAVTGGTFYTSTAFGAPYRNNYFFGDYNSGRIMRVTLDSSNNVTSVNEFANGYGGNVDITVGPDGALYLVNANGSGVIRRIAANTASQGLIVTNTAMNLVEGGRQGFNVRLATAPVGNVTVTVGRTGGDSDLSVFSGSTLTFTPANFNVPQAVVLEAAQDNDTTLDSATFTVSSAGIPSETVAATAIDNDTQVLVLNTSSVTFTEGTTGTFTVALQNAPTGTVTVNVARTAGDTDVSVSGGATLTFNAGNFSVPQTVTLSAAFDADSTNDAATISVTSAGANPRTVAVTVNDAAPTITGIVPVFGPTAGGTMVTITGTNFLAGASVLFGGNAGTGVVVNSATQITAVSPAGSGIVDVRITTAAGQSAIAAGDKFTYQNPPILVSTVLNGNDPELQNLPAEFADQRSMVRSVRLTFDNPVTLTSAAVTIGIHPNALVPSPTLPGTISILNSTGGAGLDTIWNVTFSGDNVVGGSIGDGEYDLNVVPNQITDSFGQHPTSAPPTLTFYRLLGDANGDRTVSNEDILNVRRQYLKTSAAPDYLWLFDTDWDASVSGVDIIAFRKNANRSI